MAYLPFEKHNAQLVAQTTLNDLSSYWGYETTANNGCGCWKWIDNNNHATVFGDIDFVDETPNIQIPRPVQPLAFEWSVRDNQIYINLLTPDSLIENCVLDVTVSNLKDMRGNVMASPATWDVLIDRNPLQWVQQSISEIKNVNEAHSFSATLHNRSGISQTWKIVNLPDWLTVSPEQGSIDPLQDATLTFEVHPGLNTGSYASAAYIQSEYGFEQSLPINLRVLTPPPAWSVDRGKFENSMNIIADVQIKGVTTSDVYDMITAFVNGQCRGVANIFYVKETDQYLAFLDIFSNVASGETVTFRVWSAEHGVEYVNVTPDYNFTADARYGSLKTPVVLNASGEVAQQMTLAAGWRWISFNKAAADMSVGSILSTLSPAANDQIKSQTQFAQFGGNIWAGSLTTITNDKMYMIKLTTDDTLQYSGEILKPSEHTLTVSSGWNWVGYTPDCNLEINEALAYLDASADDLIKGQNGFAIYDANVGWQGTLNYLARSVGYKLYVANGAEFIYPDKGIYLSSPGLAKAFKLPEKIQSWTIQPEQYQYNMTITALVDAGQTTDGTTILTAFAGDECRGVAMPMYSERLKKNLYFLMVYSNAPANESLELHIFHTETQEERIINGSIRFTSDVIMGTLSKPAELTSRELRAGDRGYVPKEFVLSQNYPNPFNPTTKIGFGVPKDAHVTIVIYNIMGQEVTTLFDEPMKAGYRFIEWNSTDKYGSPLSSGMYFVKMISGEFVKTRKMMLLK